MSTKAKKAPAKEATKAEKKPASKGSKTETAQADESTAAPERTEDQEEEEEAAASSANSSGGNAAALAAAGTTEMSASFKNFRHHPDMENFYRFIFDNDLRHEALAIIDDIMVEKATKRAMKGKSAH